MTMHMIHHASTIARGENSKNSQHIPIQSDGKEKPLAFWANWHIAKCAKHMQVDKSW